MSNQMAAAVRCAPGDPRIEETTTPAPGPGGLLIELSRVREPVV